MATLDELELYFWIFCGVTSLLVLLLFILVIALFIRVSRLSSDGTNQLGRQANMMAEFCYTNPTIIPGEELSRRGFSMYSGNNEGFIDDYGVRNKHNGAQSDHRSKF